ncbi:MAG: hypothetical protein AB8G05_27465 [Oligoflexales bacterium]
MKDFFEKDLKNLFSDCFSDEVIVKTGDLAGKKFKVQFDTNGLERNLAGIPISTSGAVITGLASDFTGLDTSDTIEVLGIEYSISKILRDNTGLIRIETLECLGGGVVHGEL